VSAGGNIPSVIAGTLNFASWKKKWWSFDVITAMTPMSVASIVGHIPITRLLAHMRENNFKAGWSNI